MNTSVNCLEVRRILGAEPQRRDLALLEHCKVCAACAAFMKEMLGLDVRLSRALAVDVPEGLEARIVFRTTFRSAHRRTYPWLAAAAAVVLAVGLGIGAWRMSVRESYMPLAEVVVQHIMQKSQALLASTTPVNDADVSAVLERVGAKLQGNMGPITYANTFYMHGQLGAHLVMMTPHGAVTLLLLPHIHVDKRMQMDMQGFHCMIDPIGIGSIVIVASASMPMDGMEQHIMSMVQWAT
ncbi:MAG TPA: DUF3379 family protein [Gammaproteobacteria bacterium]|nr:DUF3379 family protein [Gammaproteobacteria bacterium]